MPKLPGGPLATRPLHFFFIADCSSSMAGDKIQSLNQAIRESIPHMREVARGNPNAEVLVRSVAFANGAQWHHSQATSVEQFEWNDLSAGGMTSMGRALSLVADVLRTPPMPERALPPVLVLVTDGAPTDDFDSGLRTLMAEHGSGIVQPLGSTVQQAVLQHRTHAGSGALRAQRQPVAIETVVEGIHLLLDDVGHRSDGTHEQVGLFDDGHADVAVSIGCHPLPHGLLEEFPQIRLVGQDVVHPADGLDGSGHCLTAATACFLGYLVCTYASTSWRNSPAILSPFRVTDFCPST